jgi:dipeptidyl aminopeptidase/acylaminoacyl peptidase
MSDPDRFKHLAFLADEVFVLLRRLGKEVEYAKYVGETHGISGRANTIDVYTRVVRWLDAHLDGFSTAGKD